MKYRPHRGSLTGAMAEVTEVHDRDALRRHLAADLARWGYWLTDADLRVEHLMYDERTGWDTHIVTIRNKPARGGHWFFGDNMGPNYFGAIGFTDGPC